MSQPNDRDHSEDFVVYEVGPSLPRTPIEQPNLQWMPAAPVPPRRRARTLVAVSAALALAVGLTGTGVLIGQQIGSATAATQAASAAGVNGGPGSFGRAGGFGPGPLGGGAATYPGGSAATAPGGAAGPTTLDSAAATADQSVGIVLIETQLGYESAAAAGTGMILSSDGLILTNNHVIDGSTAIRVTVASTGASYSAQVVGTDASDDIALLQLTDASGLNPAALDTSDAVALGDAVTGVGNVGGTGVLSAAAGSVTGLDESITAQNADGSNAETLTGLIEVNADIQSGDSGGALLDADGEVIGINTAASSGTADVTGYAISIEKALATVAEIRTGVESSTITIGYPSFLGVAVGGTAGAAQTAPVTLTAGPAD